MPEIRFNKHHSGLADSKYLGIDGSYAKMIGCNIHEEPGILKVNQALAKDSGAIVDDFVKVMVHASDGNTYLFGSLFGRIWKRSASGIYTLITTDPNGGITGAAEYVDALGNAALYWATPVKLAKADLATFTANFNFATLSEIDGEFHPMVVQNLVLYIGAGSFVDAVEDGIFSGGVLNLKNELRIRAMAPYLSDILIGTFAATPALTRVIRWDTFSLSFAVSDPIPERGVNAFIPADNFMFLHAGEGGNIYYYNGAQAVPFKTIFGTYNPTARITVNPNAAINFNRLPLFAFSSVDGNPVEQGVYSFGRNNTSYPRVPNLEYVISQNKTSGIEIGAITSIGINILVSWRDSSVYGVDKIDFNNKFTGAFVETRVVAPSRYQHTIFQRFSAAYANLPTGSNIQFKYKKAKDSSFQTDLVGSEKNDSINRVVYAENNVQTPWIQMRAELVASGNNAPEVEEFKIDFE